MKEIFHNNTPIATRLNIIFLMGFFFFIPIQATPAYFFSLFSIIAFIFKPDAKPIFLTALKHPLTIWFIGFFLIHPVSLLWTENFEQGLWFINKYIIFLLFPIFLAMMQKEWIPILIGSFLAGVALSEITSYALWFDLINIQSANADHTAFVNHILYSPIIAFSAYVMLHRLLSDWSTLPSWKKAFLMLFSFTIVLNLFFTHGRTGMVAFSGLLFLLVFQHDIKHRLRNIALLVIGLPTLVVTLYFLLPDFQIRADAAIKDLKNFFVHGHGHGSINARLVMWVISIEMISQNWLIGVGIGDFESNYQSFLNQSAYDALGTINPHNQYLFTWATTGIVGFGMILGMLYKSFSLNQPDNYYRIRQGILVLFIIIMLFESYWMRSNTSILWVMFIALLHADATRSTN